MPDSSRLSQIAEKVLQDPILLRKLTNRIYELITEDIRNHRDAFNPIYRRIR
jgi:hypothetical protein